VYSSGERNAWSTKGGVSQCSLSVAPRYMLRIMNVAGREDILSNATFFWFGVPSCSDEFAILGQYPIFSEVAFWTWRFFHFSVWFVSSWLVCRHRVGGAVEGPPSWAANSFSEDNRFVRVQRFPDERLPVMRSGSNCFIRRRRVQQW
jgi:hypothetical protein